MTISVRFIHKYNNVLGVIVLERVRKYVTAKVLPVVPRRKETRENIPNTVSHVRVVIVSAEELVVIALSEDSARILCTFPY